MAASAPKCKDRAQARRFIEAARKHGVSEDGAVFDRSLKRIAKVKRPTGWKPD
jgi:hypothetical protein